jgi:signal recognition particle subunit SRP54
VRIANGSGVTVTEVNQLLERFAQAQKMMGQMAGSMGLPGMGPMSKKARGRQMQAQSKKGKKGKGGRQKGGPRPPARGAPAPAAGRRQPLRRRLPGRWDARRHARPAAGAGPPRSHQAELRPAGDERPSR